MSCFRHEDDWGPPEHGSEPSAVCFRLLFGGYCAVWCDVGHGLTARDGRGLALHVVQLDNVRIPAHFRFCSSLRDNVRIPAHFRFCSSLRC